MSSADRSDRKSGKGKIKSYVTTLIVFTVIGVVIGVWKEMYDEGGKCQNDIDAVNHVINSTGGIDSNSKTFQQLGVDGCADLSKSSKGFITTEITP